MKDMDNKKADRIPVREKYEPVKVEVMEVASQGVLCASAGATINGMNVRKDVGESFN